MHLTRSDLVPERISSLLAKDGGYRKVSWLKNSSIFPPRICVDIYICENSRACILSSRDSVLADRPIVFDSLNVRSLFFLIGSSDTFAEYSSFSELSILFSSNFFNISYCEYGIICHHVFCSKLNKFL